jgi:hypothetical protein
MLVGKGEMMMQVAVEGMIIRLIGRLVCSRGRGEFWSFEGNIFIHYGGQCGGLEISNVIDP